MEAAVSEAPAELELVRRPSLEELLPLSESPLEGALPPLPEEFLTLDESDSLPTESARSPRRSGPRRRRLRGTPSEGADDAPASE